MLLILYYNLYVHSKILKNEDNDSSCEISKLYYCLYRVNLV